MVYITKYNLKRIANDIPVKIKFQGQIYKTVIDFFSHNEEQRLLAIKELCNDPNDFIRKNYHPALKTDSDDYIKPTVAPAFHYNFQCKRLNSDFINYKIPPNVKQKKQVND